MNMHKGISIVVALLVGVAVRAEASVTLYEAGRTPGAVVEKGKLVVAGDWNLAECGRIDITFSEPCRNPPKAYSSSFLFRASTTRATS